MILHLPWFDSMVTGTPGGTLVNGNRYIHYSSPLAEKAVLFGLNVNFVTTGVTITLANKNEPHAWSPFYHTALNAVAGEFDDVEPVLLLPVPIEIPPFSRIQIALENLSGGNLTNTRLTLVGTREMEMEILCFS
jgi:hypothetical protein